MINFSLPNAILGVISSNLYYPNYCPPDLLIPLFDEK